MLKPSPGSVPGSVADLSPYELAGLLALRQSRHEWRPLTPTRELSIGVLRRLAERGLIRVPWPDEVWPATEVADTLSSEMLGWQYAWEAYPEADELDELLQESLRHPAELPDTRLQLWNDLSYAETIRYAQRELEKHQLDAGWALDLGWVQRQSGCLSMARWRYVVWSGVRRGATELLRSRSMTLAREAIQREYLRRAEMVRRGDLSLGQFSPQQKFPDSLLARVLVRHVLPIGEAYWTTAPDRWAADHAELFAA